MPEQQRVDDQKNTKARHKVPVIRNFPVVQTGQDNGGNIPQYHGDQLRFKVVDAERAGYAGHQKKSVNGNRYHKQPQGLICSSKIQLERVKSSGHNFTSSLIIGGSGRKFKQILLSCPRMWYNSFDCFLQRAPEPNQRVVVPSLAQRQKGKAAFSQRRRESEERLF